MTTKKIITIVVMVLLAFTSIFSLVKVQNTNKQLNETIAMNTKLNAQNKKLIEANSNADKKIDELAERYEVLNEELTKLKEEAQNNQ